MNRFHTLSALGMCFLMLAAGSVRAADAPGSDAELLQQLKALEARINQLQRGEDTNWLNQRRTEEVKALVREVLADADTRASLLQEGATAGHNGKNFFLASQDGSFLMNIQGQIQLRYVYNDRDGSSDDEIDRNEFGFEIPRAKLSFNGHVGSPRFMYEVRLAVDRNDNNVYSDKIVVGYQLMDGVTLWGGEAKAPFLREELTEPTHQLAVDRSLVNDVFTLGVTQGIWANIDAGDMVKLAVSVNDGARSGEPSGTYIGVADYELVDIGGVDRVSLSNHSIMKPFDADRSDIAFTARVDVKIAGDWAQMDDFSAWGGQPFGAFVGGAIHYEVGETGDSAQNNNFFTWTVDGSVETNGFNVYGAVVGLHTDNDDTVPNIDLYGFVVQGGYNINDKIEPFLRWEYIDAGDLEGVIADDSVNIITFGANYYVNQHRAKLTVDLVWALDTLDPALFSVSRRGSGGLGLLPDAGDNDDQFALRAQFQLMF